MFNTANQRKEDEGIDTPSSSTESKTPAARYQFKIDYRKLGEELMRKIEHDELYWRQNDAKIRAVNQTKSYEEFRQVVLAAHLTPLKREEKDSLIHQNQAIDRVCWNPVTNSSSNSNTSVNCENSSNEHVFGK